MIHIETETAGQIASSDAVEGRIGSLIPAAQPQQIVGITPKLDEFTGGSKAGLDKRKVLLFDLMRLDRSGFSASSGFVVLFARSDALVFSVMLLFGRLGASLPTGRAGCS